MLLSIFSLDCTLLQLIVALDRQTDNMSLFLTWRVATFILNVATENVDGAWNYFFDHGALVFLVFRLFRPKMLT